MPSFNNLFPKHLAKTFQWNQLQIQKFRLQREKNILTKIRSLRKRTIQIFMYHEPDKNEIYPIEPLASGFLLKLDDESIVLITAAHVSDWEKLCVGCSNAYDKKNPQFQTIEGTRLHSLKVMNSRDDDKKDWSMLFLDKGIESYFKKNFKIPYIGLDKGGPYILCGYPLIYNKVQPKSETFQPQFKFHEARELSDAEYKRFCIDKNIHIALHFFRGVYTDPKTGKKCQHKSFRGYSGGPILDQNFNLIAVFNECRKSHNRKVLIGTRINAIKKYIESGDYQCDNIVV